MSESHRLHPATLIVRWFKAVPQMLGGGAAYSFAAAPGRLLFFILLAAGIGALFAFLSWWRFRYSLGDDAIVIEHGVLRRQRRVIPFDRVQDIAIEQRLIARLFGTARARIETGSAGADEGDLDMIAVEEAHALRDRVRKGSAPEGDRQQVDGEALTAPEPSASAQDEPVLFQLGFDRLLYSGLFNFSLLFLAAIFAVIQNLDQYHFVNISDWFTPKRTEEAAGYFNLRFTLILVPLVIALGLLSGVVRTVRRDFGFRLTRSPAGLRRRRGLTTLSEAVIPLRRTQVALIESGVVGRQLGWHQLSFETLGADRKEGGVQVAAPFARMDEILPILAEAGFPTPPEPASFHRVSARSLLRSLGTYAVGAAVLVAAAILVDLWLALGVALFALLAIHAVLSWRRHLYAVGERALFVRRGVLTRRLSIIPFERTQAISVSRGPLQRRLRLATLLVDTAGAPVMRSPEIVDLDAAGADRLADRLLALFYEARSRVLAGAPPRGPIHTTVEIT
jgi:putative membrane protein